MKEQLSSNNLKSYIRFKELKTYCDTEWIMDSKKKYRTVFDRHETTYIYVEMAFYNKKFDLENWDIDLLLKCVQLEDKTKEICRLELHKKISKYDSIAYLREGWGNKKKGTFWKGGEYQWEAYIGGKLIGTKIFHVVDNGNLSRVEDFLDIQKIAFFEGSYEDVNANSVNYLKEFSQPHTRYVFCEISFKSMLKKQWPAEFFIKYYNQNGDLKTIINRIINVDFTKGINKVVAGFGSNTRGSWTNGVYKVEIMFMNNHLATTSFVIGDELIHGLPKVEYVEGIKLGSLQGGHKKETFEDVFEELNRLVGLSDIKNKVKEHAQYIKFLQLRNKKGFQEDAFTNINSVFIGNPGTGKTTVARLMGRLYHQMGILSQGHVHEVDRVDLIGEFIGQTAPKVKEAINKAKGGILFIDEAYALARSQEDSKDFGREAIEVLIKEMSTSERDFAVVVAGYPKEMKQFIDSNPGLKSRFKHYFEFPDYLPEELIQIAEIVSENKGVSLNTGAKKVLQEIIIDNYRKRDKSFGNARFIHDLVERAKINLGIRIMNRSQPHKIPIKELKEIKITDVLSIKLEKSNALLDIPIDHELLNNTLSELNGMVGISKIKAQVKELIEIVKYHKASGKNVLSSFFLHTVFIGNPGTGKTTVARLLAKIYKALGILERGHLVETDRQGLVAGFVGQTAIKTSERIDEAMGGVLFIDEAYALNNFNGLQGDFGNEAIQTILKRMEDDRGRFFLFVAGYPDNMDKFLKANPGLSSRFDKKLIFEDYSPQELIKIGKQMVKSKGYHFDKSGLSRYSEAIHAMIATKDQYFGNARAVRQLVNDIITTQNLRIASIAGNQLTTSIINKIKEVDVSNAMIKNEEKSIQKRQIGFNN